MRISDIIILAKSAIVFAIFAVAFFAAIWFLGYKLIYQKKFHGKKIILPEKIIPVVIFAVYIVVVVYVTLLRGAGYRYTGSANLLPLSSYKEAWYNFSMREWRNLILNICMFVPFGFLLPACFRKLDKSWRVYICGFAASLFIELIQLVSGCGVFETDDIINNTLGAMIGYGLFIIVCMLAGKIKRSIKCLAVQLPLLIVIIAFGVVFLIYDNMEYGNLYIDNVSKHKVNVSMADGIELSDKEQSLEVYTINKVNEDEARNIAEEYFQKYGVRVDDSKTDRYDDTIIFVSTSLDDEGNSLSLWCDYEGATINFTDFSTMGETDNADNATFDNSALTEKYVRDKLEKLGVFIPPNAVFKAKDEYDAGNYTFIDDGEVLDDGKYYKGTIDCYITSSGEIGSFRDSMIKYTSYRKVKVISEREAYEKLCAGKFYNQDNVNVSDIEVRSVGISYLADTKGYYRPVYEFKVRPDQDDSVESILLVNGKGI